MRDLLDTRGREQDTEAEALVKREALAQEIADFKWLMSQPQGQRFAWRLLEKAGVYHTTFNSSGSITAFNEGKRAMGLWLVAQIHDHTPETLTAMIREANK